MPKKAKATLPSWYVSKLKKEAVVPKRYAAHKAAKTVRGKDVNYTIPGMLALFGIVLVTALYFTPGLAYKASSNAQLQAVGNAYSTGQAYTNPDTTAAQQCQVQSRCEGSKLIHQQADCIQFTAFCQHGCLQNPDGAVCR